MSYILETERLKLREFSADDSGFIVELLNSPGWIKFIGNRNVRTEEQAYLENGPLKSYRQNGFGLCLVELKNEKTPIGMCGILKRDTLEKPDIGFAFLPQYTGRGYGFEIASATLKYAKDKLELETVLAITVSHNKSSIRLLEKTRMRLIKPFCSPGEQEELLLFSN